MRRAFLLLAASALFVVTGCQSDVNNLPSPTLPPPEAAPGEPAPETPAAPAPGAPAPGAPAPTRPPNQVTAQPRDQVPTQTTTEAAPATSALSTPDAVHVVNHLDYRHDGGYYFTSPTGNLMCGIVESAPSIVVGCQSKVLVANMPHCNDPDSLAAGVWIPLDDSDPVVADCVNQGFWVGLGAKPLPYGSALDVIGFRCESAPTHMECRKAGSTRGFTMALEGVTVSN